ncbi:MAG: tryptophan--tRNA ligase [Bacteroidota bacterium]|nr:tryptophan--tRNA ligase [Bacteroidota bacterium]
MARILTGIQSSGKPHLGNILGAISPAIALSEKPGNQSFLFIADLHALTTVRNPDLLRSNTQAVAAAWLAFGFNTDKNLLYRQSDIPIVTELAWLLGCLTPYPMLANAHSFKDKSERLADVNAGLFTYPVLMACDILLYDGEIVPVGKDQIQHLEMARDIAEKFNNTYGNLFTIPKAQVNEQLMTIPGTDGQKMSKSYNNTIDIFLPEKELKKNVMSIVTDSTPLEEPKNPDTCNVFKLYELLAETSQTEDLRKKYLAGGFGYGHAKQTLFELIMNKFQNERNIFTEYMNNSELLEQKLTLGAQKATAIAEAKIIQVRKAVGLK